MEDFGDLPHMRKKIMGYVEVPLAIHTEKLIKIKSVLFC